MSATGTRKGREEVRSTGPARTVDQVAKLSAELSARLAAARDAHQVRDAHQARNEPDPQVPGPDAEP
ncbi:hypothetical protein ITI46_30705, partial [Streptomyces oryzae]